jgi:hypothetical protein
MAVEFRRHALLLTNSKEGARDTFEYSGTTLVSLVAQGDRNDARHFAWSAVDIADSRLHPGDIGASTEAGRTRPRQSLGSAFETVLGSASIEHGIECSSELH